MKPVSSPEITQLLQRVKAAVAATDHAFEHDLSADRPRILCLEAEADDVGFVRIEGFRVLGGANRKLEERLHLGDEATLILSSSEVDGFIVAFVADRHHGYEITIESKKSL